MGLDESSIQGIVDNSNDKEGKRLYGTGLIVYKPSIIKNKFNVMVIIKAGQYQQEIENISAVIDRLHNEHHYSKAGALEMIKFIIKERY